MNEVKTTINHGKTKIVLYLGPEEIRDHFNC